MLPVYVQRQDAGRWRLRIIVYLEGPRCDIGEQLAAALQAAESWNPPKEKFATESIDGLRQPQTTQFIINWRTPVDYAKADTG